MAEYRFHYSEEFLIESFRRYRRQHHQRYWLNALKIVGFVGLVALIALFVYLKLVWPAIFCTAFLLLLAVGPRIDYWLLKRKFRKSPFYNTEVVVAVTSDGYVSKDRNSQVQLGWPVFTKARRFSDGLLIFNGPQQFHWWPDTALVNGTVAEVEALIKTKVPDYEVA